MVERAPNGEGELGRLIFPEIRIYDELMRLKIPNPSDSWPTYKSKKAVKANHFGDPTATTYATKEVDVRFDEEVVMRMICLLKFSKWSFEKRLKEQEEKLKTA